MFKLYYVPGLSSMAAHIALHEVGTPFEAVPLSPAKGENKTPDYLALNPEGKVPTLIVNGKPLTEVAAILYFLAKRFPQAHLLPMHDIECQAQAISWMSFLASSVHPARRFGEEQAARIWAIANGRLGRNEWAIDDYSVADIHLFRLYWRYFNSKKPAPGTYPNLDAHYARMMKRPAVIKTIEVESKVGYNFS